MKTRFTGDETGRARAGRRWAILGLAAFATAACAGRAGPPAPADAPPAAGEPAPAADDVATRPPVLLVSIDGFRPDYLDRGLTPNLNAVVERGVLAEALIPSFPTKTFPNHYTIVTGLRPDRHGLVANNMWDPGMRDDYSLSDRDAVGDARWYAGEPVWVAAERHGLATATLFWPGSEAAIQGMRPEHWKAYDGDMPHRERVDWVVSRLAGEEEPRVHFATLYFEDVDTAGHHHGPVAGETDAAIARVDSAIGYLLGQLEARVGGDVNLIVVSDHGMSSTSRDRVIFLDDYLDPEAVMVSDWNPVLAIWPGPLGADSVHAALAGRHPHLEVHHRAEIPARYEYGRHERVAPVIGIADPGWSITTREEFARNPGRFDGGTHGYDHQSPDMRALFIASGPAFRTGVTIPSFPNVDVYELIMAALDLPPAPGDGRLERASGALRAPEAQKTGEGW